MQLKKEFLEEIDDVLIRVAESLQLDESRLKIAETSYKAIGTLLEEDDFFKSRKAEVYPQGSFRLGTAIKPLGKQEFDLDIVLHLQFSNWREENPLNIYNKLYDKLKEHGTYKDKLERKKRCARIVYANNFHMDILPAYQEFTTNTDRLVVPDRELKEWSPSNPKGYAKWFESKYIDLEPKKVNWAKKWLGFTGNEVKAMADFPQSIPYQFMQPLQRSVQLIKRYRDIYFSGNSDQATSSIILTTLAGMYYEGQDSEFATIDGIVNAIYTDYLKNSPFKKRIEIPNPANPNEKFSDKWESQPELYESFIKFINDFKKTWDELKKMQGLPEISEIMKKMLGNGRVIKAIENQTEFYSKARQEKRLYTDKITVSVSFINSTQTKKIESNTFYGE